MATLMFPIGHCLGTYYTDSADDHVQQVRLGGEIVELSDEEFTVWSLAHGMSDEAGQAVWDRTRIMTLLTSDFPAEVIDRLLDRHLLAEVDMDDPTTFAVRHRLLPLQLGLGNTTDVPAMFRSGTTDLPLAGMSRVLYDLWLWAHLSPNLLAACKEHQIDLKAVLNTLHALLTPNAACLDFAAPEQP